MNLPGVKWSALYVRISVVFLFSFSNFAATTFNVPSSGAAQFIRTTLTAPANFNVVDFIFNFGPGVFVIGVIGTPNSPDQIYLRGESGMQSLRRIRLQGAGRDLTTLQFAPLQNVYADAQSVEWWMIDTFSFSNVNPLERIEIQNLTLDGNFSNQGLPTTAANGLGYKSGANSRQGKNGCYSECPGKELWFLWRCSHFYLSIRRHGNISSDCDLL